MKINLEKACIGFLIGILLFCVCNKMFMVEGYEVEQCAQGKNERCRDGTLCDNISNCVDPEACICPGGGPPPPSPEEICNDLIPEWCMKDSSDVPYGCADQAPGRSAEYKGRGLYLCSTIYRDMGTCESDGQGEYIWCAPKNAPGPGPGPSP